MISSATESNSTNRAMENSVFRVVAVACASLMWVSCQTLPPKDSEDNSEEKISSIIAQWENGFRTKNVDRVISVLGEDFVYYGGPIMSKPGESGSFWFCIVNRANYGRMLRQGWIDAPIDLSEAELWIYGDEAIVTPVMIGGAAQSLGLIRTENGWRVNRLFAAGG